MKLYFLKPQESDLVADDLALINAIRACLLEERGHSEAPSPEAADAIIFREKSWFKEWRFINRLLEDPIVRQHSHRLYTINSDDSATGLLRGVYTSLPVRRYNPSLHRIVPYDHFLNDAVLERRHESRSEPRYLATWRGNTKSNRKLRTGILRICGSSPAFRVETTDSWQNHDTNEQQHYVDVLVGGKFSLCPAGWAAVSMRIYESMSLGVCPVIIADDFVPPLGPDWDEISVRVLESDLPRIESILTGFSGTYREKGERAREAWERLFSPEKMIGYYSDALLACIAANPNPGPAAKEFKRWKSFRTYWSNNWTLAQRVQNKLRKLVSR